MKTDKIKGFLFCVLLAISGFQSGFIFKCYWDYKNGPVPMITPSEIQQLTESANETPTL